ncbi:MAG: hypothetical protein M1816_005410 [Peltula sp. TS41687]|nr:MAG: hypothetical protein M1816_005410 [Peltula sp. TS41687]
MAPSLSGYSSIVRPRTSERDGRPGTRDQIDLSFIIPSRTSSLHSRITQPMVSSLSTRSGLRAPKTLTHAYMVCGVGREPSQWVRAPQPAQGKIQHMKGAVGQFWLPEILGSSPRLEHENDMARSLYAAMRACFPHDVEICTGRSQPHCVHHSFVLQQDSSHTLYGIALRVWSRADEKRAETIRDLRKRTESDYYESSDETYWIPYCLSFLSRYPLYDLLGDYLRGMWIHWNKATNLFHAEEVSRILSFPAPRLNDLVRIDMKDYALCYQFPSSTTGFQNFAMWPLFSCLSIPNIVGIVEAALSPTRRIIFVSHYPAMLTVATETIRFLVRVYEWSGLYVPVMHARHVTELVQEPGPYILGVTAECRSLFSAPSDALVIDLDRNFVLTSSPPTALSPGRRTKMINRLTQSLRGEVSPSGVPQHLRSAYGGGKLIPAGQIIVMRGEVESIKEPEWWNQDGVMAIMDHVCQKMGRNTGIKALFGGSTKKPLTSKVSMRHLNELVRERNQYSRDALEAWQDFITLKGRMDTEVSKITKRNNFLVDELESWKQQFLKFQSFAETLTKETQDLKVKIDHHKRENRRLTNLLEQQKDDAARLTVRLSGTEKQRDDALEALILQQEVGEQLEHERKRNKKELSSLKRTNSTLMRQKEEAQRVVVHLRSLIDGQAHHMEHIIRSLNKAPELSDYVEEGSEGLPEGDEHNHVETHFPTASRNSSQRSKTVYYRAQSRASTNDSRHLDGEDVNPDMERRLLGGSLDEHRSALLSFVDVADRHLQDKTDAITDIIRNISEQCAAAVEGLHMARDAEEEAEEHEMNRSDNKLNLSDSEGHEHSVPVSEGEEQDGNDRFLRPTSGNSTYPPTPDLVHRSSTSMSINSQSTTPERHSQQYVVDLPTKIIEDDDEGEQEQGHDTAVDGEDDITPTGKINKQPSSSLFRRPAGARISALGHA